jgi:hypothetical protein
MCKKTGKDKMADTWVKVNVIIYSSQGHETRLWCGWCQVAIFKDHRVVK